MLSPRAAEECDQRRPREGRHGRVLGSGKAGALRAAAHHRPRPPRCSHAPRGSPFGSHGLSRTLGRPRALERRRRRSVRPPPLRAKTERNSPNSWHGLFPAGTALHAGAATGRGMRAIQPSPRDVAICGSRRPSQRGRRAMDEVTTSNLSATPDEADGAANEPPVRYGRRALMLGAAGAGAGAGIAGSLVADAAPVGAANGSPVGRASCTRWPLSRATSH